MAINLNIEKYGAQFNAFVDFAAKNADNGDTLARISADQLFDPEGNPRTIVAKTDGDKIKRLKHNLLFHRDGDQERLNNAVRDLFKETVFKVCGARNFRELPQAVRDVMKESDFKVNGGHPLSVRRILAVTRAIQSLANEDPATKTVSPEKAEQLVDGAVAYVTGSRTKYKEFRDENFKMQLDILHVDKDAEKPEVELTGDQRAMAARLVSAHGTGLADSALKLLANFTVAAIAAGKYDGEDALAEAVSAFAKNLAHVRSFRPDDAKASGLNARLKQCWQNLLGSKLPVRTGFFAGGLSMLFTARANTDIFTIGGEKFIQGKGQQSGGSPKDRLTSLVKNPEHLKAITTFMSTDVINAFTALLRSKDKDSNPFGFDNVAKTKDANCLLKRGKVYDCVPDDVEYALTLSEDGKKAVVTARESTKIRLGTTGLDNTFGLNRAPVGVVHVEFTFEFDLSDPCEAELTGTSVSQTIEAGEDAPAKAPEDGIRIIENDAGKSGLDGEIKVESNRISFIEVKDPPKPQIDGEKEKPEEDNKIIEHDVWKGGLDGGIKVESNRVSFIEVKDPPKPKIEEEKPQDDNKIIENNAGKGGLDDGDVNPADFFADNHQDPFADPDGEVMENDNKIIENEIIVENDKAGKIVKDDKPEAKIVEDVKPEAKIDGEKKPEAKIVVEDIKPEIKPDDGQSLPDTLEKLYGAKRPYFGKFLFNVAKATVDAAKGPVAPGELRAITDEEFAELRQKSSEVDVSYISGIVSNRPANIVNNLIDYRDTALEKFESLYPAGKDKDTPIMREIKRNLFINLALEGVPGANISSAAFVLKANNNKLVNGHGLGETLNLLYPGFALKARTLDIRKPL